MVTVSGLVGGFATGGCVKLHDDGDPKNKKHRVYTNEP